MKLALILYLFSIITYLSHAGGIDAWLWDDKKIVPKWVKSDEYYLLGKFIVSCLILFSAYFYSQNADIVSFSKTTLAGLLAGSVCWDLFFGHLLYRNALYPYSNWVTLGNHKVGFENVSQRIFFDLFRLGLAVLLIISN